MNDIISRGGSYLNPMEHIFQPIIIPTSLLLGNRNTILKQQYFALDETMVGNTINGHIDGNFVGIGTTMVKM